MFVNITPVTHVSDITLDKAHFLHCIIHGIIMDVAEIISNEIHKFVISHITTKGTTKHIRFHNLIIKLCKANGVHVPTYLVNTPMNKPYILTYCTNTME